MDSYDTAKLTEPGDGFKKNDVNEESLLKSRRGRPVIIRRQVPLGFNPKGKTDQIIIAR